MTTRWATSVPGITYSQTGRSAQVLFPSLEVVLLDSLKKRLDWLEEVCGTLGLEGIRVLHARAEEQGHCAGFRDGFDVVTSRAVASLELLAELCLPFVKVGGVFLAPAPRHTGTVPAEQRGSSAPKAHTAPGPLSADPQTAPYRHPLIPASRTPRRRRTGPPPPPPNGLLRG